MQRVTVRRVAILAIALSVVIAMIGFVGRASFNAESVDQEGLDGEQYSMTSLQPERSHFVKFRRFSRYGPLLSRYTSSPDKLWEPETTLQTISYRLDKDRQPVDILIETRTDTGDIWFSKSSSDGEYFTVTNHRLGVELPKEPVVMPPVSSQGEERTDIDTVELFRKSGFEIVRPGLFNGRNTTIMRNAPQPFPSDALIAPAEDDYISPVVYDLDADEFVVEMHIDSERGTMLRMLRYAIDSEGKETLIESFEWLALQEVS